MKFSGEVEKVNGGFQMFMEHEGELESAVASTARQAGLRAGELVRKLVEAEFLETRNGEAV